MPRIQLIDAPWLETVGDLMKVPFSVSYITDAMQEAMEMLHAGGYLVEVDKWIRASDVDIPGFLSFIIFIRPASPTLM